MLAQVQRKLPILSDWIVALVFFGSAAGKAFQGKGEASSMPSLPQWASWIQAASVSWMVAGLEIVIAILLIRGSTRLFGRVLAIALLCSYLLLITAIISSGQNAAACGCFGSQIQLDNRPHVLLLIGLLLILNTALFMDGEREGSIDASAAAHSR